MESIGVKMEMERELKGLSIEDVATDTKISTKYIVALENENYEEIPGDAYIKAFLRNYSVYLGLNPDEIIQKYDYNMVVKSDVQLAQAVEDKKPINWRPLAIGGLGVILAVAIVFLSVNLISGSRGAEPSGGEVGSNPARETAAGNRESPPASGVDGQIEFDDSFIYLVATAGEKVWISISADGKPIEPATGIIMDRGETRVWRARARFEVDTGNAGGLELEFNGRPVGALGYSGEVIHGMVFTKNRVKVR